MRVLMLGWEFPPHMSGGLGIACFNITKSLSKLGVDILFVMPKLKDRQSIKINEHMILKGASGTKLDIYNPQSLMAATREVWEKKLTFKTIDSPLTAYADDEAYLQSLLKIRQSREDGAYYKKEGKAVMELSGEYGPDILSEVYRYGLAVANIALKEDFDVIHAHDWMTYPAGMILKELTGKPLVCHIHATEFDRSGLHKNHEVAHIEWAGMQAADRVIAVSHYTRAIIKREYLVPDEKITVAHNAVGQQEARAQYEVPSLLMKEKRVLFMGRITFQKGPDYFVEAAKMVADHMPNVRFIMAGSGDMLTRMVKRVAELRMGRFFHFTGFLRGEEVDRMYALSDLYVMPSVSEPFGIAPLEAMNFDVPVIIARQSGVSEVLPKALRVNFWDVHEMANKICAVLSYPTLAKEVVKNCQEALKDIKWENNAEILINVYRQVANI